MKTKQVFVYKANGSKLVDTEKLSDQIVLAIQRIIKYHKPKFTSIYLKFGTMDDDFINDKFRVAINFELQNDIP